MAVIARLSGTGVKVHERASFAREDDAPSGDMVQGTVTIRMSLVNSSSESFQCDLTVFPENDVDRILPDDGEYTLTLERS